MSHSSPPPVGDRPAAEQNHESADVGLLLEALDDADCRAIIEETDREALSASELSDACGLPLSTTYRKIDKLTEAGLLEEEIRISTVGKHTSEYSLRIRTIQLSLGAEVSVSLELADPAGGEQLDTLLAGAD